MFGDTWDEEGVRTRSNLLTDFNRDASPRLFSRLRVDRKDQPGQSEAIIRIERFVDYVLSREGPAYKFKGKTGSRIAGTGIGKRLRKVYPLHFLFDGRYTYSEKPSAFLRACKQALLLYRLPVNKAIRETYDVDLANAEAMNLVVDTIRKFSKEEWFTRAEDDRRYQAKVNGEGAAEYVAAVLNHYARTVVVRLDFGYVGGSSSVVTIDRAWDDFGNFLQLLDYHHYFRHMTGYMWSFEQGKDKGFHMHLVVFFDGSEVCRDIVKGNLIGRELWVDRITQGMGTFHNCNMHKDQYAEKVGIGVIRRVDSAMCLNAIRCLQYLPKGGEFLDRDDQYCRIKTRSRMHTFGMGCMPDVSGTRVGRPAAPAPWMEEFLNK